MAIRDLWNLSVALEPKMSALPPKSRHWMTVLECPLWAKSGLMQCSKKGSLFDHLVGADAGFAASVLRYWA
jgi:hypothetical protein